MAAKLQIAPLQWTSSPMQNDTDALRRAFDPNFNETLKVRCVIEIKNA